MLKQAIGKRIKELRIVKKEMNQEEFASLIGCDKTYISRIESGKQNITIENLNQICNDLDITLNEFFEPFNAKFENEKEVNDYEVN